MNGCRSQPRFWCRSASARRSALGLPSARCCSKAARRVHCAAIYSGPQRGSRLWGPLGTWEAHKLSFGRCPSLFNLGFWNASRESFDIEHYIEHKKSAYEPVARRCSKGLILVYVASIEDGDFVGLQGVSGFRKNCDHGSCEHVASAHGPGERHEARRLFKDRPLERRSWISAGAGRSSKSLCGPSGSSLLILYQAQEVRVVATWPLARQLA